MCNQRLDVSVVMIRC